MVNIQFQRLRVIVIQLSATELNHERKEKREKERENREDRKDRYVERLCSLSEVKEGQPVRVSSEGRLPAFIPRHILARRS